MATQRVLFDSFIASFTSNNKDKEFYWRLLRGINMVWTQSKESTLQGSLKLIEDNIEYFLENMKDHSVLENRSVLSLQALLEMYSFAMKRLLAKFSDPEARKENMIKLGQTLIVKFSQCKKKIFKFTQHIIKDEDIILVVGYSSLLKDVLIKTSKKNINIQIKVLELRPECDGHLMYSKLLEQGITCELIPDAMLGIEMQKVNYVMTGAEAVTENGGLINRCGTYTTAIVAKALQKPLYVLCENYKLLRLFPHSINDIPFVFKGEYTTSHCAG